MEDLWKKHKRELKNHFTKINDFLESELNDTTIDNDTSLVDENSQRVAREIEQIQKNIVIEEPENIKRGRPRSERRKIYGKLRDIVKSLMEKEGLSRAQAYRRAKKIHEKFE